MGLWQGGRGPKKSKNFADVICERPRPPEWNLNFRLKPTGAGSKDGSTTPTRASRNRHDSWESRGWLLICHLRSLNGLKFALFYHLEYIWRRFFKTRNSRTLKIHVVFLCTFQFSGVRFKFRIANVSFLSHLFIVIYYLSEYHVHVSYRTKKSIYT